MPLASLPLLVSGLGGDTGGGLYVVDGRAPQEIDRISSTGLAVGPDRFPRLIWSPDDTNAVGEVLVYDARGVQRYLRIDTLREPHSAAWDGNPLSPSRLGATSCCGYHRVAASPAAGTVQATTTPGTSTASSWTTENCSCRPSVSSQGAAIGGPGWASQMEWR